MGKSKQKSINVAIISNPMGEANISPFFHFVNIMNRFTQNCLVIATHGTNTSLKESMDTITPGFVEIIHNPGNSLFSRPFRYLVTQIKISYSLLRFSKRSEIWILYLDGGLILPMILSKLLRKKTIILLGGYRDKEIKFIGGDTDRLGNMLAKFNLSLCNIIVVYSPLLISDWHLEQYRSKILIAHEHFIEFARFTVTTPLSARPPLVGYIGRLSAEKGIQNFVQALPAILDNRKDLRGLIGGDGQLKDSVISSLEETKLLNCIDLPGWISHHDLPSYLNRIQLLVLPSYTEGLPNIMLEAMACGTPVLVTPVGAIPDVIKDGATGFIMENNTPECITDNVRRALGSPELEKIAENARHFVEREYTFEKTVENWEKILQGIE